MNRSLVVFLVSLSVAFSVGACFGQFRKAGLAKPAPAPKVTWHSDLKTAHKAAVSGGRPIVVVVGGPNCGYCTLLDKNTLQHPDVAGMLASKFVAVRLDKERDRRLCEALEIEFVPTTLVLNSKADVLAEQVGYVKKAEFCKLLDSALDADRKLQTASATAD